MFCYSCGAEIRVERKPARQDTCPKCGSDLHCCRNCRFYDPKAYHQYHEPQAEWVKDKEMANFCEYFEPREAPLAFDETSRREAARKKLQELFKKKP